MSALLGCGVSVIFDCLARLVRRRARGAEVGLTEAQQVLLERHPRDYLLCRIEGATCDMGTPAGYLATQTAVAKSRSLRMWAGPR